MRRVGRLARPLGYASLRDYARGRAGVSLTRFLRLRRVGLFLRYLPGDLMWLVRSENRFRAQPSFFRFGDRQYLSA